MSNKVRKIIRIISLIIFFLILTVLAVMTWRFVMDREGFKAWMDARGFWGYLAYIVMVILQILVALIPGGPIEMAGGYAFGVVLGTTLFFIGSIIGSLLVFWLVRKFGRPVVELFFSDKDLKIVKFLENPKKRDILFGILFIIPGSPKDLLCYVAGLTPMKLWFFAIIATFGRLPAVIASAVSGSALGEADYTVAVVSLVVILVLSGIGVLIYRRISKKHLKQNEKSAQDADAQNEKSAQDAAASSKKVFRKDALARRNALDETDRMKWSLAICSKVTALVQEKSIGKVLIYSSYDSEVDTHGIMEKLWALNVDIYCPKVEGRRMEFYKVESRDDLVPGFKDILEPADCAEEKKYVTAEANSDSSNGMIIVPGCAFDRSGFRMGYGGGYYDRYLPLHPELLKVAVAFESQICESVPVDEYDVRMDYVITEK